MVSGKIAADHGVLCRVLEERQDGRTNVRGRERRPSSPLQHRSSLRRFGVRPSSLSRYLSLSLSLVCWRREVVTSGEKGEREREKGVLTAFLVVTCRTSRPRGDDECIQSSWHFLTFFISDLEAGFTPDPALPFATRRRTIRLQRSIILERGSIILRNPVENKKRSQCLREIFGRIKTRREFKPRDVPVEKTLNKRRKKTNRSETCSAS